MGLTFSKADAGGAPGADTAPPALPNFSFAASAVAKEIKESEPVDYLNLPQPLRYEDIQRESIMALKPDLFEGMRFEITKPLNQNFFLSHSLFMGNMELQTGGKQIIKAPVGNYEFGANVINEGFMLLGRIATDGRLSGRVKYDVRDWLGLKVHCQLANEAGASQMMADADVKGKDWNAQLKLGHPMFLGLNYFQSVTPKLALGGEFFWLHSNLKSGVGFAARHTGDKHVATMQVCGCVGVCEGGGGAAGCGLRACLPLLACSSRITHACCWEAPCLGRALFCSQAAVRTVLAGCWSCGKRSGRVA